MVTVGFCAILIGLGVDFAILVFGRYQQARDDGEDHPGAVSEAVKGLGRAIFFGALTTAVGFLALMLAGSRGFTQLGVLIAIGIVLAGIFTMTVFFLFLPRKSPPPRRDWMFTLVKNYVRWAVLRPAKMLWISTPILVGLTAVAVSPKPPIIFDVGTHSMEPKRSDAGLRAQDHHGENADALGAGHRHGARREDAQQLHDYWQKVEPRWAELQAAGKIKGFSTPAALALSPQRLQTNRPKLQARWIFAAAREALEGAIAAEGFSRETFESGLQTSRSIASAPPTPRRRSRTGAKRFRKPPAGGF